MKQNAYKEALVFATGLCAKSERCRSEIETKLVRFGLDSQEQEKIFVYLESNNYLNEVRFAESYTNDKIRFAHWGMQKIRFQLRMKGIPDATIESALETVDLVIYLNNLRNMLDQKKKTIKAASVYELKAKLARFALGRGYDSDNVWNMINTLLYDSHEITTD
jgi:regulatory protein